MSIELYAFPPSPRAFKAIAVANHLGVEFTLRMIDLLKGDQKTPEYAALNPNQMTKNNGYPGSRIMVSPMLASMRYPFP